MFWISIALVGYLFLAATFILDKFILSRTSVETPSVYAFYSTIIMWGALVLLFFSPTHLSLNHVFVGLASGVFFGLGLYTLYRGVKGGEASHINPLSGASVTVATYSLSHFFLFETLSMWQVVGVGILVIASILLSYEETAQKKGFHIGYVWAIVSGIFFAASHVSAKYLYELYEFLPAFAWTRAGAGLVGLALLVVPVVRSDLYSRIIERKKSTSKKPKQSLSLVWVAKILGVCAVALLQYASALGSVSVVQAMSGVQYALMFLAIYFLSRHFPKLFKEYFSRREVVLQMSGIVLVIIGSIALVVACTICG